MYISYTLDAIKYGHPESPSNFANFTVPFFSPCLEMKFNVQVVNQIHEHDFIATKLSQNYVGSRQYYAIFKVFLSIKNLLNDPISRSNNPNWKIHSLLTQMNFIFPAAWLFGIKVAINKMTIGFQRFYIDKKQVTYKAEGDGFQADALADEGCCYQFYMQNNPIPKSKVNICLDKQE